MPCSESNPLISVILPVYNCEKYIASSINSILQQTYKNFELIIINDGSSDSTLNILNSYDDVRIRIVNRQNMGLVYSLNEGISLASGQFIARMDADDLSDERRFESQLSLMQSKQLDICGCNFSIISENNKVIGFKEVPIDNFNLVLMTNVPFAHGSIMMRKKFIDINKLKYGMSKYIKAEDYQLWVDFYEAGAKFGNVSANLFCYRDVSGSLSTDKANMNHAAMISYEFIKKNENNIFRCISKLDASIKNKFKIEISRFLLLTLVTNTKAKSLTFLDFKDFSLFLPTFIWFLKVHIVRFRSKLYD